MVYSEIKFPHVFKLTKKSGRVILSYKDWPLIVENYREVDLDSLIPDLSTPVTLKPNLEKVRSSVEEMKTCKDVKKLVDLKQRNGSGGRCTCT